MASSIFRDRLINSIKNAVNESKSVSQIDHTGTHIRSIFAIKIKIELN